MDTVTEKRSKSEARVECPLCHEECAALIEVKWVHVKLRTFPESSHIYIESHECFPKERKVS